MDVSPAVLQGYASDPDRRRNVQPVHVAEPELAEAVVTPAVDSAFRCAAAGERSASAELHERQIARATATGAGLDRVVPSPS